MAKLIHAQMLVDGLSMQAYRVLNTAFEFSMSDNTTVLHRIPLADFYRLAHLAASTTRMRFARIVEEAKGAILELEEVDTIHPDKEAQPFGCWPAFEKTKVTDTHFEFEFCPQLRYDGIFFSGYWVSVCPAPSGLPDHRHS